MKKLLSILAITGITLFSGCSGAKGPAIEGGVAVEKETATYKYAAHKSVDGTTKALADAGFEVVGTYKNDVGTTVLYTSNDMKTIANKPNRALAAVGRVLVDDTNSRLSISNPIYFDIAFMQDEYSHTATSANYNALEKAFGTLADSPDKFQTDKLANYNFMIGMPYYQEMSIVGEGATADLLAKAKKSKSFVSSVELDSDRHLVFVNLEKRTNGFVKKIGTQNAGLLPWGVIIENNQAKALSAKYYIAITYPLLTMGEFMTIATVPGAIENDLKKVFK